MQQINIFWFRRDLRLYDNVGLYHALKSGLPVLPVFIFDTNILSQLEDKDDRRVSFIYQALLEMQAELNKMGSTLCVLYSTPEKGFTQLFSEYSVDTIFTNHDYEPYAQKRDESIKKLAAKNGTGFRSFKDQVIFEKTEIVKDDGKPYTVFTPYSKKWKLALNESHIKAYPSEKMNELFLKQPNLSIPSLSHMGFHAIPSSFPSKDLDEELVKKYSDQRDFPGINGTSKLGVHLRFGTVSIRFLAQKALELNATFLNELIWRDFYQMILWNFPQVGEGKAFKPEYDSIVWRNDEGEFEKWCNGETGYPIVDAGMRELNTTGYMHNRVRMIVASFLTKHLLLDWRLGEAYFAKKLLDFDLAANNGGWQWAAGTGCDAAPYFRIFNPYIQTKKFDPNLIYIKKWVPEFQELTYPLPIVNHEMARERCLKTYAMGLGRLKI